MIGLLAATLLLTQERAVRGVVLDGVVGAPVVAALVSARDASTRTNAAGRFVLAARVGDTLRIRRIGYREARVPIDGDSMLVALTPVAATLGAVRVADSAVVGHLSSARTTAELRERGIRSLPDALATMPFVSTRGGHGESSLSLRGSRPEQVLVLIDGMPLNDPATGRADVSDLPLAALEGVSVTPGAAAAQFGSGASGGVVALRSGGGTTASAAGSSLAGISLEGAYALTSPWGSARIGVAAGSTRNDFRFLNDAGARDTIETRQNADERRASLFGTAIVGRMQLLAVYAVREHGLAGPKNVRAYDDARESSDRRLARMRVGGDRWITSAGVRRLAVRYRDGSRSELASNAYGTIVDADGLLTLGAFSLRAGGAREKVWGTNLADAVRPSGFMSGATRVHRGRAIADASARLDVVHGARGQLSPALAVERSGAVAPFARIAQGFRLPAFYDLYAPTPLGFVATGVAPERVLLDAEAGARLLHGAASFSASVFARNTRDAIVWFPGNFNWSPTNVTRERVRGLEARGGVIARLFAGEIWASSYVTRLAADGTTIPTPYVPRFTGGASGRLSFGGFGVSTRLSATGRRPFAVAPASRTLELPGVLLADINASWRFAVGDEEALLTAGVLNVGNTAHESIRRYPLPGRSWQLAITVQPRG